MALLRCMFTENRWAQLMFTKSCLSRTNTARGNKAVENMTKKWPQMRAEWQSHPKILLKTWLGEKLKLHTNISSIFVTFLHPQWLDGIWMNICFWNKIEKQSMLKSINRLKDFAVVETPSDIRFCHRLCVTAVVLSHQNNLKRLKKIKRCLQRYQMKRNN